MRRSTLPARPRHPIYPDQARVNAVLVMWKTGDIDMAIAVARAVGTLIAVNRFVGALTLDAVCFEPLP